MVVDRHEDYWTEQEKRERETGTSLVAGTVLAAVVIVLAIAFAVFTSDQAPQSGSSLQQQTANRVTSTR
jgi:hypothetical protein